jgi:hypothetical protein
MQTASTVWRLADRPLTGRRLALAALTRQYRLGLYGLVQIKSGHEVMFTAPERLAAANVDAGRD